MSIRAIAQELYKCQSRVHRIEGEIENTQNPETMKSLKEELRQAKAELRIIKNMLEGRKQHSTAPDVKYPRRF